MENLIYKFWKGDIALWRSYWLVGELLNALFILLIFNLEIYLFGNNKFTSSLPFLDFENFSFLSKLFLTLWTVFITIGIWRSAENYKGSVFWIIATFFFLSYRIFTLRLIFFN
ncbi:MAG: hypothetical protein CMG64_07185 [Candidatus Marinimicrobia bacterium]|nr:hypothetical protein [Candidatus Neomarinimicrobiota bacterium]|tara:strand:- start:2776 stop:3114 length:339 start_codon:yes stop_codon:yes gene_type:complete